MTTIRQAIDQYSRHFTQAELDSPRLNAELLTGFVLGLDRGGLLGVGDRELTSEQASRLASLAERRLAHEPVDYILGEREFYGRRFAVRPGVLVPRPSTETVIDLVKRDLPGYSGWAAEIGAGSGIIAVTLALELASVRVIATDISAAALAVAAENAAAHQAATRVHLARMDGLTGVAAKFDLIVSNPPYVDPATRDSLQPEVLEHEPSEALFGGADGLETPVRLLAQAAERLNDGGLCLFEHAFNQGEAMREAAARLGLRDIRTVQDMEGLDRVLVARR